MMGRKKLGEIKAEAAALLARLPGQSSREWLDREIASAKRDGNRDVETLEMLCDALERGAETQPRRPAKR